MTLMLPEGFLNSPGSLESGLKMNFGLCYLADCSGKDRALLSDSSADVARDIGVPFLAFLVSLIKEIKNRFERKLEEILLEL